MGASALAWGAVERRWPTLRRYEILLPAERGVGDLTILHLADLHLFPGQEFLIDFLEDVAASESFDLVVATGDNFGSADGLDLVRRAFAPFLGAPGAFVLGSNDYYSPLRKNWGAYLTGRHKTPNRTVPDLPWSEMTRMMRDAGWIDLSNRSEDLAVGAAGGSVTISLTGTDDAHIRRDRIAPVAPAWADPFALRLGVTHAPYRRVIDSFTESGADLILAGHTHGGQIGVPVFGALVTNCDLPRRYAKGLHRWRSAEGRSWLHVSAGLGTSPYARVRIATRPEASLIRVRSA
ncbi:metallophosphoesterase [Actinomyces sp. B33]|nr:metallophosphoesterase [Actinomyces sp. B33]MDC4232322.1 metallophosphoesterase [Actinomyces sp. B33]